MSLYKDVRYTDKINIYKLPPAVFFTHTYIYICIVISSIWCKATTKQLLFKIINTNLDQANTFYFHKVFRVYISSYKLLYNNRKQKENGFILIIELGYTIVMTLQTIVNPRWHTSQDSSAKCGSKPLRMLINEKSIAHKERIIASRTEYRTFSLKTCF